MRESAVEKAIVRFAEDHGLITLKLNGPGNRGKPDRWFGLESRSLFLEVKRPGEEPTALQYWWMEKLQANGFASNWCDNVEDGTRIILSFIKNEPLP